MNSIGKDTLEFRRTVPAPPTRVFSLWTTPGSIRRWFGGEETRVSEVQIDLRPGGEYRIDVEAESGPSAVYGQFLVVEEPTRLHYTWTFTSAEGTLPETTVEVEFLDLGESTEVVLRHGPFPTPSAMDLHQAGWEACFQALENMGRQPRSD